MAKQDERDLCERRLVAQPAILSQAALAIHFTEFFECSVMGDGERHW